MSLLMQDRRTDFDRVVIALRNRWVCAAELNSGRFDYGKPIWRFSARIHEARLHGYEVERRRCENEHHSHQAVIFQWRIVADPPDDQMRLFADEAESGVRCGSDAAPHSFDRTLYRGSPFEDQTAKDRNHD